MHMRTVWKLVVLIAVLLMPLGMQPAAASATMVHGDGVSASMPMEHCPGQPKHEQSHGFATCSMACASALPAQRLVRDDAPTVDRQLVMPMAVQTLQGVHPKGPAPPPKLT